jgi:hypothetical protein
MAPLAPVVGRVLLRLPGFAAVGGGEAAAIFGANHGGESVAGFDQRPIGRLAIFFGLRRRRNRFPIHAVRRADDCAIAADEPADSFRWRRAGEKICLHGTRLRRPRVAAVGGTFDAAGAPESPDELGICFRGDGIGRSGCFCADHRGSARQRAGKSVDRARRNPAACATCGPVCRGWRSAVRGTACSFGRGNHWRGCLRRHGLRF